MPTDVYPLYTHYGAGPRLSAGHSFPPQQLRRRVGIPFSYFIIKTAFAVESKHRVPGRFDNNILCSIGR